MKSSSLVKVGMFLIIIVIVIAFLIIAKNILIPFAVSIFFAYLIYPLVAWIEKKGVHRAVATLSVLVVFIIVILGAMLPIVIKISNMPVDLIEIKENFDNKSHELQQSLQEKTGINAKTMDNYVDKASESILSSWQSKMGDIVAATTTTLFQIGLIPVFVFFLLYYRTKTAYFVFRLVGKKRKRLSIYILKEISTVSTKYLSGILIVVVILSVLNSLGLYIIGVPHAIVFGIIAAILNLIPYIGTVFGGLIPLLYVLFTEPNPNALMIKIVILFVIIQFTENNLLTPNIVGDSIKINPLAIILSLLLANMVWGIPGMLIVIPVLAILKVIMRNIDELKPFAYLISDRGLEKQKIDFKFFTKIKNKFK